MEKFTNPLENIRIASPCAADWNEMIGNERQRFCSACKLNVYNLSGMSRREAENLILQSESNRLCVRFYRRSDGTILTDDCPVGWKAIKRNISKTATAFASLVFTALSGISLANYLAKSDERQMLGTMPVINNTTIGDVSTNENSNAEVMGKPSVGVMGNISVPYKQRDFTSIDGRISNLETVRSQIKNNRRR